MLHPRPRGQLPGTDGSGCRQAAISAAQAFDDSESVEEVKALLEETWPRPWVFWRLPRRLSMKCPVSYVVGIFLGLLVKSMNKVIICIPVEI